MINHEQKCILLRAVGPLAGSQEREGGGAGGTRGVRGGEMAGQAVRIHCKRAAACHGCWRHSARLRPRPLGRPSEEGQRTERAPANSAAHLKRGCPAPSPCAPITPAMLCLAPHTVG